MKGVMRRTFNVFQWEALLLLVAGITGARRRRLQALHGCRAPTVQPLSDVAIFSKRMS